MLLQSGFYSLIFVEYVGIGEEKSNECTYSRNIVDNHLLIAIFSEPLG